MTCELYKQKRMIMIFHLLLNFVQGPVCTLCVYSSLLFSGSSDNSIKVSIDINLYSIWRNFAWDRVFIRKIVVFSRQNFKIYYRQVPK